MDFPEQNHIKGKRCDEIHFEQTICLSRIYWDDVSDFIITLH